MPASAGFIRISTSIDVPDIVTDNAFYVNVTLTNTGDEAAHAVSVSMTAPKGGSSSDEGLGDLEPNVPVESSLLLALDPSTLPGTYPMMLMVRYSDSNAYPFSTVTPILIRYKQPAPDNLDGDMGSVSLTSRGEADMKVHLGNLDSAAHKIRLRFMLPDELKTSYESIQEEVAGRGAVDIPVSLRSEGALAGSTYPVYAVAEYEDGGIHHGLVISGTATIIAESASKLPSWLPTAVVCVLMASIAYYQARGAKSEGVYLLRTLGRTFRVNIELLSDALVMLAIYGFLLSIFTPELMLSQTITTGGDTASHYYPAKYLRDELLPHGRVIGWLPGWYAGMPLFQYYFPLAFILIAVMGYVIPLQIAFKVVTVLGIFSLPLCSYVCMRLMRFDFPTPIYGASFSLPFLFMESHSMWGGNIPSTMAGEFTYGISLSLTVLFFGTLYRWMLDDRRIITNSALLAAIALTHVYTVLWVVTSSSYLLLRKMAAAAISTGSPRTKAIEGLRQRLMYLMKSYPLAFMLSGFFIIPMLVRLKYTTSYDIPWNITEDIMPAILWPFLVFSVLGVVSGVYSGFRQFALERKWPAVEGYLPSTFVFLTSSILGPVLLLVLGYPKLAITASIAILALASLLLESRIGFLCYSIAVSLLYFCLAARLGVVDIRFLPFIYLALMLIAGWGLAKLTRPIKAKWLVPLLVIMLTIFWVDTSKVFITSIEDTQASKGFGVALWVHLTDNSTQDGNLGRSGIHVNIYALEAQLMTWKYGGFTPYWIKWNYDGFEKKALWPQFKSVNDFIKGDHGAPRAQFEHNDQYNSAGTVRAFESIPLFSGRSILEGLYMQSIISSPFAFYIQSEISDQQSCPFWAAYPCTSYNLVNGTRHLKMFNVKYIVARSDKAKAAFRGNREWALAFEEDPYEVWELTTNPDHYVTVPINEPVLFVASDWKNISYNWFRRTDIIDTPIVFEAKADDIDRARFNSIVPDAKMADLESLQQTPIGRSCEIIESVQAEYIEFNTTCVGVPHIISISYYPSWKADGADRIYLVSPSFMLVYPSQPTVRLYYAKRPEDWLGLAMTLSAVALVAVSAPRRSGALNAFFRINQPAAENEAQSPVSPNRQAGRQQRKKA